MIWIAPSEKDTATDTLEKRLWDAADQFRANSGLKAQECSGPILGLIFLRFAEVRFTAQRARLEKAGGSATAMQLASPPSSVGEKFDRLVAPMIDEAELLGVKIQNLRQTRDLLLPRLLSGGLALKNLTPSQL